MQSHHKPSARDYAQGGILGFIGFMLSPLSWWNDLFINVPLAYGFAWLIGKVLDLVTNVSWPTFFGLFSLGYLLSNIAGFLLLGYGTNKIFARGGRFKHHLMLSLGYTLLIIVIGLSGWLDPVLDQVPLAPSWVVR